MITPTAESPILIVGAGPVGLLIAVGLQRHGVPVQLLERRFHQPHPSRASTFQPAVLDCLDSFGLLRGLEQLGRRVEHMAAWDLDAGLVLLELVVLWNNTKEKLKGEPLFGDETSIFWDWDRFPVDFQSVSSRSQDNFRSILA